MLLKLPCLDIYENLPVIITHLGVGCFFFLVPHKKSKTLNYDFGHSHEIAFLLLTYISLIFQVNLYFIHIIDIKIFQKDQRNSRPYGEVIVFHQDLTRFH